MTMATPEDWAKRVAAIPSVLRAAGDRKAGKLHARSAWLLVYLDLFGTYGVDQAIAESSIRDFIRESAGSFAAVHVLWNDRIY